MAIPSVSFLSSGTGAETYPKEDFLLIRPFFHQMLIAMVLLTFLAGPRASGQEPKPVYPPPVELTPSGNGVKVARAIESFSTLSLEGSELPAEPPLEGGTEKTPQYVRDLVRLQWRPNDPIDLYVVRPAGVKNPPVVLYLYSYPSDIDRFKDDRYCQRLVQSGAAAVGFVSALTGYRFANRPLKTWFISELAESLATTVHDVQLILNYLDTRGDLDMSRVGMFGQGSGGAIAILAAATDSRLKALDLFNPLGDWPDWLAKSPLVPKGDRSNYLQPDFLKRLQPLEPVGFLPALKSCAIRIQVMDDEAKATQEAVDKLVAAAPASATIIHYPNGHAMYAVSSNGRMFEWIATALKSLSATQQVTAKSLPAVSAQ